jgi:hypothetical protein
MLARSVMVISGGLAWAAQLRESPFVKFRDRIDYGRSGFVIFWAAAKGSQLSKRFWRAKAVSRLEICGEEIVLREALRRSFMLTERPNYLRLFSRLSRQENVRNFYRKWVLSRAAYAQLLP